MFNIFKGGKWYETVLLILALPFIISKEIYDIWKTKKK